MDDTVEQLPGEGRVLQFAGFHKTATRQIGIQPVEEGLPEDRRVSVDDAGSFGVTWNSRR